mgnify:CR=1 FL=1
MRRSVERITLSVRRPAKSWFSYWLSGQKWAYVYQGSASGLDPNAAWIAALPLAAVPSPAYFTALSA